MVYNITGGSSMTIDPSMALLELRPNAEFSWSDNDLSTLIWHTDGVKPVTKKELDNKIKELEDRQISEIQSRNEKIQSALLKLQSLGLTEQEAKALAGI